MGQFKRFFLLLVLIGSLCFVSGCTTLPFQENSDQTETNSKTSTAWCAHRGRASVAPENTLIALAEAVDQGIDGVDVARDLVDWGVDWIVTDRCWLNDALQEPALETSAQTVGK